MKNIIVIITLLMVLLACSSSKKKASNEALNQQGGGTQTPFSDTYGPPLFDDSEELSKSSAASSEALDPESEPGGGPSSKPMPSPSPGVDDDSDFDCSMPGNFCGTVLPPALLPPTCTLGALKRNIMSGERLRLYVEWHGVATRVFIDRTEVNPLRAELYVSPTQTTRYEARIVGPAGEGKCEFSVSVMREPPKPTSAWYAVNGAYCPSFCAAIGKTNVGSYAWKSVNQRCASGEAVGSALEALGTGAFVYGCWGACSSSYGGDAASNNGYCYRNDGQKHDGDRTDITVACHCGG